VPEHVEVTFELKNVSSIPEFATGAWPGTKRIDSSLEQTEGVMKLVSGPWLETEEASQVGVEK
jgi:hypothetical protein